MRTRAAPAHSSRPPISDVVMLSTSPTSAAAPAAAVNRGSGRNRTTGARVGWVTVSTDLSPAGDELQPCNHRRGKHCGRPTPSPPADRHDQPEHHHAEADGEVPGTEVLHDRNAGSAV